MAFTYTIFDATESGIPAHAKFCVIDEGTLTVSGEIWTCNQTPAHGYKIYRRNEDGAVVFVGQDSGIVAFEKIVVSEASNMAEVITMALQKNLSVSEQSQNAEVITMKLN